MSVKIVLSAVNFDNETVLQADEINDVAFAWRLPTEVISALTPRAEMIPDFNFLRRERLS
jgi:hypothetical protein